MSKRLEIIEELLKKGSSDPFVWYGRAMELRSMGRLADALQAFQDVADKFSDYVPTYLMAGQVAAELSMLDEARSWLEKGITVADRVGDSHAANELRSALETLH